MNHSDIPGPDSDWAVGGQNYDWACLAVPPIDTTPPNAQSLAISNGGSTAGRPEQNDVITVGFSEAISPSSMCTGWTGSARAGSVTVVNGGFGDDSVTVSSSGCGFNFGDINLNDNGYVNNGSTTFGATITLTSGTLTIVLGAASSGGGNVTTESGSHTAVYDPEQLDRGPWSVTTSRTATRRAIPACTSRDRRSEGEDMNIFSRDMEENVSISPPAGKLSWLRGEKGQTLVEYALIIAVVSLGALAALGFLSGRIQNLFSRAGNSIEAVTIGAPSGGGTPPPPPPVTSPPVPGALSLTCNDPDIGGGGEPCNDFETVTVNPGTWGGTPAPTLSYQWATNGNENETPCTSGGWTNVGTNSATFTLPDSGNGTTRTRSA